MLEVLTIILYLFIILSFIVNFVNKKNCTSDNKNNIQKISKYNKPLYLLLILGLIIIRCIGFGSIPGGFNQDGAMGAVDALALANYGTDRLGTWLPAHFTAWGFGQMSVLLSYLSIPFIKLWGLNSITARLPMLIASIGGAYAVYFFVKNMISEKAALVTLFFLAINPWHFMQSRWALDCNMFPHMFIIGLCLLNKGIDKNKFLYISMIFFALCMYSYGVAFYMVPIFLIITAAVLVIKKYISIKQAIISAAIYIVLSFPISGTMIVNFMKWDTVKLPFTTMTFFEQSKRASDIIFFTEKPFEQLISNFNSLINIAFLQKHDLMWNAIDKFGTIYKCSMPFILTGVAITIYRIIKSDDLRNRLPELLLIIYWICSIITGLLINNVNINRINIIFYSHIIFAGISIYYIIKLCSKASIAFIAVYGIMSVMFFNYYFTTWADEIEDRFLGDFIDAVEYAGSLECDYYYITPDTQYEGSSKVSEILTMFAIDMDAKYYQGKTNIFMGKDIPCSQRFIYRNPSPDDVYSHSNTAFVIKTEKLSEYHTEGLSVEDFGKYTVMVS